MPGPFFENRVDLFIELVHLLIVFSSCLFIYFKTRELYQLSSHKGIRYFRYTFLFFGITFLNRFLFHFTRLVWHHRFTFHSFQFGIFEVLFFIMVYTSTMSLVYLALSLFWKKLSPSLLAKEYLFHIVALVVALVNTLNKQQFLFLVLQGVFFIVVIFGFVIEYMRKRTQGGTSSLILLYFLIIALWIVGNVIEYVSFISVAMGIVVYAISLVIYLVLLWKVLARVNPGH